jgi:hypothetical protein
MARKMLNGQVSSIGDANSGSCVALHRLLHYAAREAAAQNRFTTTKLIQAAIASLVEQAAVGSSLQRSSPGDLPPLGHC